MKIFKLKYFVILMVLGLLGSCQMEDVVTNSPNAIAARKKQPLPDGIPSDADDPYEFDKSQYYNNNVRLTDTTQIKNLLNSSRLLYIDGSTKYICTTDQEATLLYQKLNIDTSMSSRAAALDGDNYMHYMYEINRDNAYGAGNEFYYFNIVGPHYTSDKNINFYTNVYRRTTDNVNTRPTLMPGLTHDGESINCYITTGLCLYIYPYYEQFHCYFTINCINVTRFTRLVTFEGVSGRKVQVRINSKKSASIGGLRKTHGGVVTKFNGIDGFKLNRVYSQKV